MEREKKIEKERETFSFLVCVSGFRDDHFVLSIQVGESFLGETISAEIRGLQFSVHCGISIVICVSISIDIVIVQVLCMQPI